MADFDFDAGEDIPRFSMMQTQRMVNIAGAVCSIGLITGVLVWGYNLAVRDVSGVPVIRAAEGPMRIAPPSPGGTVADHQGMAVNAIPELGSAEPLPEEIILAPEPVRLGLEDEPGLADPLTTPMVEANSGANGASDLGSALVAAVDAGTPTVGVDPIAPPPGLDLAAADGTIALDAPASEALPLAEEPVSAVDMALAEALGLDVGSLTDIQNTGSDGAGPGLSQSPRPLARPSSRRLSVVASEPIAGVAEIDPATLSVGTRLVQLGAFDTTEAARTEWASLTARFGDLMSGKSVVLQPAESGGRTFYRLRATGFDGEDDARRFCSALEAEDASCVPVVHR